MLNSCTGTASGRFRVPAVRVEELRSGMTVKHVSAPKTPGLQAAGAPRRSGDAVPASAILNNRPHSGTDSGGIGAHSAGDGEFAAAQTQLAAAISNDPSRAGNPVAIVDYYAIISKTVGGLVLNNPETRAEVYDHAREVVNQRLIDGGANMSSRMIAIEQIAFDRAIRQIETEQSKLDTNRPPPPPRPRSEELRAVVSTVAG